MYIWKASISRTTWPKLIKIVSRRCREQAFRGFSLLVDVLISHWSCGKYRWALSSIMSYCQKHLGLEKISKQNWRFSVAQVCSVFSTSKWFFTIIANAMNECKSLKWSANYVMHLGQKEITGKVAKRNRNFGNCAIHGLGFSRTGADNSHAQFELKSRCWKRNKKIYLCLNISL